MTPLSPEARKAALQFLTPEELEERESLLALRFALKLNDEQAKRLQELNQKMMGTSDVIIDAK